MDCVSLWLHSRWWLAARKKKLRHPLLPQRPPRPPRHPLHLLPMHWSKIGHVAPTSGPIAHLGKDNEFGAKMAIEELNAKGSKIGDKVAKFELAAEDDGGDPKQGTAAAQKLVDSKVNGVVGHLNSGTTIPASKLDSATPASRQISPSATNPKYTRHGFKTTFRVVADDSATPAALLGKYAVETLKGKNIAVIDDRTAYGQGVAEEFEQVAPRPLAPPSWATNSPPTSRPTSTPS